MRKVTSASKFSRTAEQIEENSEAARMKKQEYLDKLPKSREEIRRYIDEKVIPFPHQSIFNNEDGSNIDDVDRPAVNQRFNEVLRAHLKIELNL